MEITGQEFKQAMEKMFFISEAEFHKVLEFAPNTSREHYKALQDNPALFVWNLNDLNLNRLTEYLFKKEE